VDKCNIATIDIATTPRSAVYQAWPTHSAPGDPFARFTLQSLLAASRLSWQFGDPVRMMERLVKTCANFVVVKNQLLKAITQSFQSELRSYVEDIRANAEEVQGDIQLVKAQCDREEQQLQTIERKEASNHLKRLMAWTSKSTADMEALQAHRMRNASG